MRSPFAIFRKHQKMMTVVLTGLAMFAFVILGAVPDPSNMPPTLVIIVVAAVFGGIGWVAGIRKKKSSEYGLVGVVIGTLLGLGASMATGPRVKVYAETGDLNVQEFQLLHYQRSRANEFVIRAFQLARERAGSQFMQPPPTFVFHEDPDKDVVIGELLRHEAKEMGIVVSDAMVNDFITAISQGQLGAADVKDIRDAMGLSESDLYNMLRQELMARIAEQYLYDWSALTGSGMTGPTLPPETYWDFYRRLHVREKVGIVPIPVRAFLDESAEPSEEELQKLFATYRNVFPNRTEDGAFEEGRPGFRQPRKVQLAYLEAAFNDVQKLVEPPTDEEIEAFYDEYYGTVPQDEGGQPETDARDGADESAGPALPAPRSEDAEATEEPAEGNTEGADLPPAESEEKPAPGEEQDSAAKQSAPEEPAPAEEAEPASEEPAPQDSGDGALLQRSSATEFVALLQNEEQTDAEAADPSANDAESDGAPTADADQPTEGETPQTSPAETEQDATEQNAAATDQVPADSESAPPPPPLPQSADEEAAPPEAPAVRELDDELRREIREQIIRERTGDKLEEVIREAAQFMQELELRMLDAPDDPSYLTRDQAMEELKAYAEQHNLTYAVTPPLSAFELQTSEDYPIGTAVDQLPSPFNPRPTTRVVEQVFRSEPREVFRSRSVIHPETESRFVYWKIDDKPEFVPESLDDPGIRDQVVTVWRELKAREKAESRAAQLVEMVKKSDKPLSEVFAGQTVTGKPDDPAITVLEPPPFSWLSKDAGGMAPNPLMNPPRMTRLQSVPGQIGESFMKTIFDRLQEGEVGVAHSIDKDYYYVVRVDERTYGTAGDRAAFREQFMKEPVFAPYYMSDYPILAQAELSDVQTAWQDSLLKKYNVTIVEDRPTRATDEDAEGLPGPTTAPTSYF